MCWRTNNKPICHNAKSDIVCYKVMHLKEKKHYYPFFWKVRYTYKSLICRYKYTSNSENPCVPLCLEAGCDYFASKYWFIDEGYHSFESKVKAEWEANSYSNKPCIVKCIIPKGSEYYHNEYGEYVSDQIIILNPIK